MEFKEKNLVFFDVDNTIIDGYSLMYFIKYLFRHKIINRTKLSLVYVWFILYKLRVIRKVDFGMNFILKSLAGWNLDKLDIVMNDFFDTTIKNIFFKKAIEKINEHLVLKHKIILVSTSIEPIIKRIAGSLGVEEFITTKLEVSDGVYTGFISGHALERKSKLTAIREYIKRYDESDSRVITYFYTDHYSDSDILDFVDKPFVVNPDRSFLKFSKGKGWSILNFN